ncbi:peptidase inhibitor family I36 protein [Agromyces soli]|uniref:Peptidase inhibitor family I36 protein n=1 Tax=Agromyces soli TaxID=659012 RepID=A0ABY4APC7_9MICO|nr:peptidase inhibitor family I36 protein [Agromyces soli]UOE25001.1 peptidase inhibitor family I36 protein [Agromyces soli]
MKLPRIAIAALITAAAVLAPVSAATAATAGSGGAGSDADGLQQQIDAVLAEFPGGVQTGPDEVSWQDGAVVLNLAPEGQLAARSVGSCATGAHCVYSGVGLSGSKLTFSTCSTQSVAPLGAPVASIANARSVVVRAYNSVGVVGSVSANSSASTSSWGVTKVGC